MGSDLIRDTLEKVELIQKHLLKARACKRVTPIDSDNL